MICICDKPVKIRCKYTSRKYWVFGYTKNYVYIKKKKSYNKYYKTYKLDIIYIVNTGNIIFEYIKNKKVIYNHDKYSITQLRRRKTKRLKKYSTNT